MRAARLALAAAIAVVGCVGIATPASAGPLPCDFDNPVGCYVNCLAAKTVGEIKRGDLDCPLQ